jgi:hypothetical protein
VSDVVEDGVRVPGNGGHGSCECIRWQRERKVLCNDGRGCHVSTVAKDFMQWR